MDELKLPLYARIALILLFLAIVVLFLYYGQHILIPLLLSLLFAILLRPVAFFLNKRLKFPPTLAAIVAVILFILLITGIVAFVSWKISDFAEDWNNIKKNLSIHYEHLRHWIKQHFDVSYNNQEKYLEEATKKSLNNNQEFLGNTLSSFTGLLLNLVLIPVYTFLFLLYKDLLVKFLSKLLKYKYEEKLHDILKQVKIAIQHYLVGLLIEMGIVATLTSIGLTIIGVQYAILLGVITGILNLIPYIGIIIAAFLTIIATLTNSTDLSLILGVIIVNAIVQLLDNNILIPWVVSSKVKINAIASIVGIITAGAIAGIAGMFLAIPLIAILKVIFDRIDALEPWGFVMGDDHFPREKKWKFKFSLFKGNGSRNRNNN